MKPKSILIKHQHIKTYLQQHIEAHQHLFYIQITPNHNESSLLEISKFKNKVGLYDVSKTFKFDRLDYVIGNKIVRKKKWIVPTS